MSRVDLHLHSNASDGRLNPEDIVAEAARLGLKVISITDHDTVKGIAPAVAAARSYPDLRIIPGVELSTEASQSEVHILGYFIDYENKDLVARLEKMRNFRVERAQAMIARLNDLGVSIDWSRVCEIANGGSVGRPHLAQAMLEKGYITAIREAFDGYLERGGPAYVDRKKISPEAAVRLIRQVKGLPVLAHPLYIDDLEAMIDRLSAEGLMGLEAYYRDYSTEDISLLEDIAGRYDLVLNGGNDYHGLDDQNEFMIGSVEVPFSAAERLIALSPSAVPD